MTVLNVTFQIYPLLHPNKVGVIKKKKPGKKVNYSVKQDASTRESRRASTTLKVVTAL